MSNVFDYLIILSVMLSGFIGLPMLPSVLIGAVYLIGRSAYQERHLLADTFQIGMLDWNYIWILVQVAVFEAFIVLVCYGAGWVTRVVIDGVTK